MADRTAAQEPRCKLEFDGAIATLSLTREARLNAFDELMHEQLRQAFATLRESAGVRAVILTGTGRAFSAGQDLGERAAAFAQGRQPDLAASLEENYNPLVRAIGQMSCPVIAAVNGIAFGAGAGLALACDIVMAAESARFQFGFANVGLGPDCGTSWSLPRCVGQARALDLALTGRPVLAQDALDMGLVSRVVADEELLDEARRIATELAHKSPMALAATKQQMRSNPAGTLDMALGSERDHQARLGQSQDYREAVQRFAKPRKNSTES